MWVLLAGLFAVEMTVPILWWGVRQSLNGLWYLIMATKNGLSRKQLSIEDAMTLIEDKELQISRISEEIRDIKSHIKSD